MWPALAALILIGLATAFIWYQWERQRTREALAYQAETIARLQEELDTLTQHARNRQQTLFDGMVEGVLLLDAEGRIEFLNLSLRRLLGLTTDVRGKTLPETLRKSELAEMLKRVTTEGQMIGTELTVSDPVTRCLQVNASAFLDGQGRRKGTILVFHDVTRVKQFENTRREFVANVSHELRTPLSLIKGFVETLLGGAKDNPDQTTRFLQTIEKHADRLTFLIEDLLTLSRLEGGQAILTLQSIELHEPIARVIEDLQSRAAEKMTVIANLVPDGLLALADADRLEQVLFNLLENAIKYGRSGGRIEIGARSLSDQKVEVWVRDDGPGIPAEARQRVFERFYRVDRARSRETGGTGLGLAIVKHIVQAHEGEVWVQSDPGQGCTFFFTLPQS